jgi:hypothetical protein
MKITKQSLGPAIALAIYGKPEEIQGITYALYNWGTIEKIPEVAPEDTCAVVTAKADSFQAKLPNWFLNRILCANDKASKGQKGQAWQAAKVWAKAWFDALPEETIYRRNELPECYE